MREELTVALVGLSNTNAVQNGAISWQTNYFQNACETEYEDLRGYTKNKTKMSHSVIRSKIS